MRATGPRQRKAFPLKTEQRPCIWAARLAGCFSKGGGRAPSCPHQGADAKAFVSLPSRGYRHHVAGRGRSHALTDAGQRSGRKSEVEGFAFGFWERSSRRRRQNHRRLLLHLKDNCTDSYYCNENTARQGAGGRLGDPPWTGR